MKQVKLVSQKPVKTNTRVSPKDPQNPKKIAIIGVGPRGVSIIERISSNLKIDPLNKNTPLELHLVEKSEHGAGAIWRTGQNRELCMNTLAAAVTLFTDRSCQIRGPINPGPNLYEWALLALQHHKNKALTAAPAPQVSKDAAQVFQKIGLRAGFTTEYLPELQNLRPESHPSRALYGEYIKWCFRLALQSLPGSIKTIQHNSQAVQIVADKTGSQDLITLANSTVIAADATVYAAGWLPRTQTAPEAGLAAQISTHKQTLIWVRQGSPADQKLDPVPAGEPVIMRGMGMGFFDTMALLTIGRGGKFVTDKTADAGLKYIPSGAEPIMCVTSHRGVPYRSKSRYGALPPKTPQTLLKSVNWHEMQRPIDFNRQLWPRIIGDACREYIRTLSEHTPDALTTPATKIYETINAAVAAIVGDAANSDSNTLTGHELLRQTAAQITTATMQHVSPQHRFNLEAELNPSASQVFASAGEYHDWVTARVKNDIREANLGRASAIKAMLWSISAARAVANQIGSMGGFTLESRLTGHALLASLGSMLGSGPPAFRSEQLLTLANAGFVKFIGPAAAVTVDHTGFICQSAAVPGSMIRARSLIDAWMHPHSVTQTADPLTKSLLEGGRAQTFAVPDEHGSAVPTAGFDIDPDTGRLRGESGLDARVHVAGIPLEATRHETIISPMPGANPPMLRETDAVARSLIETVFAQ